MPHSSGGGSSGGGSHGGSFGGGGSSRTLYRHATPGARNFVYYDKGRPKYYYANYDITEKGGISRFFLLIFYIPFFFAIFTMVKSQILPPAKLEMNYDNKIIIEDTADVIEDEQGLYVKLAEFQITTGITPCVITTYNSVWKPDYRNMEDYAYEYYIDRFDDEKHWLIMYSRDVFDESNWYWEAMQGDDTDFILTEQRANTFVREVQSCLENRSDKNVIENALVSGFDEILPNIMGFKFEFQSIIIILFFTGFIVLHCTVMLGLTPGAIKRRKAVEFTGAAKEVTCKLCGGIYIINNSDRCPFCGNHYVREEAAMGSSNTADTNQYGNMTAGMTTINGTVVDNAANSNSRYDEGAYSDGNMSGSDMWDEYLMDKKPVNTYKDE